MLTSPGRLRSDSCPGVLRPHLAADGALVRLRVPGGQLSSSSAWGLADAAEVHADGFVHLTSRGNVQLRGVTLRQNACTTDLVDSVRKAGLLPSDSHELARNIVASPLTGLVGGLLDARPIVAELDRLICSSPALATLPGRFLFAIDDGRGDIAGMRADLVLQATSATSFGPVKAAKAAAHLVQLAEEFIATRTTEWRIAELPADPRLSSDESPPPQAWQPPPPLRMGVIHQDDWRASVSALAPLGVLSADQLRLLASYSSHVIITPWKSVLVPNLELDVAAEVERELSAAGLVVEPDSPWTRISACVGGPACAKARGNTVAAAEALAHSHPRLAARVHLIACERACGTPTGPHELILVEE